MTTNTTEIVVKVADYAVATEGVLATIGLGSCVAIALYDPVGHVGGLAHILLPDESMSRDRTNPAKFPASVLPILLEEMRRQGASRSRVRAKIAGGASMFSNLMTSSTMNIGERNVAAVRAALAAAKIPIVGADTGSDHGRSVYLFVADGRVEVRSLRKGTNEL
jgi:chemotaxis protein CheD